MSYLSSAAIDGQQRLVVFQLMTTYGNYYFDYLRTELRAIQVVDNIMIGHGLGIAYLDASDHVHYLTSYRRDDVREGDVELSYSDKLTYIHRDLKLVDVLSIARGPATPGSSVTYSLVCLRQNLDNNKTELLVYTTDPDRPTVIQVDVVDLYPHGIFINGSGIYQIVISNSNQQSASYVKIGSLPIRGLNPESISQTRNDQKYLVCYNNPLNSQVVRSGPSISIDQDYSMRGVVKVTDHFIMTKDGIVEERKIAGKQPGWLVPDPWEDVSAMYESKSSEHTILVIRSDSVVTIVPSDSDLVELPQEYRIQAICDEPPLKVM